MAQKSMSDYVWMNTPGGLNRMSYKQRLHHVTEEGELKPINFFRSISKKKKMCGYNHENMGKNELRKVFEYRVPIPRCFRLYYGKSHSTNALTNRYQLCTGTRSLI